MTHPLDGCRAKVERARELLETLQGETRAFADANPYTTTVEIGADTKDAHIRVWKPKAEPPLRLGVLMGDVVHNLRSALDHLFYQLAVLGSGPGTYTGFPLYDSRAKYRKNTRDLLAPLLPKHRTQIERVQPYQKSETGIMLRLLRDLNNLDKHVVVPAVVGQAQWQPPSFSPGVLYAQVHYREWVRMDDGAELFWIEGATFRSTTPNVQVNTNTVYTLVFGSLDPVGGSAADLQIVADEITRIVESFAPDFQPVTP